jgi:hypothetical protein
MSLAFEFIGWCLLHLFFSRPLPEWIPDFLNDWQGLVSIAFHSLGCL